MNIDEIMKLIKDSKIEFIEFRFTCLEGKWNHFTYHASFIDEKFLEIGGTIGASVPGWCEVNKSDMYMRPDLKTAFIDPFSSNPTLIIICNIFSPEKNDFYLRDPRFIAKRAEKYMQETKIAGNAYFGVEPEFFIFDDVKFSLKPNKIGFEINAEEGSYSSDMDIKPGNTGHRPSNRGGYLISQPSDMLHDIRSEMLINMRNIGIDAIFHHHEVASSQCEIGFKHGTIIDVADNIQKYKYVVKNVAQSFGKTATFMPKPLYGDSGSGMHIHQSFWANDKNLFDGDEYASLSETALFYIGGIIKHARALNAFTNASTNSYKRFIPNYEAPVQIAYSASNRSSAIRIPIASSKEARRIEIRFPDPSANPYLALAAILMAGIDGIKNKIHPGTASDENLFKHIDTSSHKKVSENLEIALCELDNDRDFLKQGGVFNDELINAYINVKMQSHYEMMHMPHPWEFGKYFSI